MNAPAIAHAEVPSADRQPQRAEPGLAVLSHLNGTSPRLPVWEERARKMGFPPSAR